MAFPAYPPPLPGAARSATRIFDIGPAGLLAGRDPACGLVIGELAVSWHHARFLRQGIEVAVEDLRSTNGTFLNGRRIHGRVALTVGDVVGIGASFLRLGAGGALEQRDQRGNLTVEVRDLAIDVPGKRLLEGVSFTLLPGEFAGLMGPSGAGKTTLMMAMNGYLPPVAGQVLWNGQDLYRCYDQFRRHLGYVPQDDIMHGELTVRQALYYSARLRLPADLRDAEIDDRIRSVLDELGLTGTEDVVIGTPTRKGISGGQRKRVNLAMELLTDPSILFLDEPTSGLSSKDAVVVMELLRKLADRGKSILLTIHQPSREVFRKMDNLLLVARDPGSPLPAGVAYYGPAYPDSIHFLNEAERAYPEPSPEGLLEGLASRPATEQIARFGQSAYKQRFVDQRASHARGAASPALPDHHVKGGVAQALTLITRSLRIKVTDRLNSAILLLQAPLIAFLIVLVFGEQGRAEITATSWIRGAGATATTIFLTTIAALWFGCSNAAREIVAEWSIYHRERMINLALPSYVGAKIVVLGGICALQCCALAMIVHRGCGLLAPLSKFLLVLVLASWVGMALGLLVSARAASSEVAISLVPLALLPMVILGGILQPPSEMAKPVEALTWVMPSRWAFESMLGLESDLRPAWIPPCEPDAVAEDLAERYFPVAERARRSTPLLALSLMFVGLAGATVAALRSRDVHR